MDMTTCVARRTRSRTESYLNSLLNKSKGITVSDKSEAPFDSRKENKRASMRDASSPSPVKAKRRRRKVCEADDDVEFIGTDLPEGKRVDELVVDDNRGSSSEHLAASCEVLGSKSLDCDVVDLDSANLGDEEKISTSNPLSPDDHVVSVGTSSRENEHVKDDNVGSASVITPSVCDILLDDVNLRGECEGEIPESDEVVSLSSNSDEELETGVSEEVSGEDRDSGDSDSDEDAISDSSEYMEESSDSSYVESSDNDFVCSEDEERSAKDVAKGRRSSSEKAYYHETSRTFPRENNMDVFKLRKAIWGETDVFKEGVCSGDEREEIYSREDAIPRKSSSRKVYEQRKPRKLRSFDCDGEESIHWPTEDSPPLDLRFGCVEPEIIEKTEEEKEIDSLWEDMDFALKSEGMYSSTPAKNGAMVCSKGTHEFVLDEEIGLKCCHCSYVYVEIKDYSPPMDKEKYRSNVIDNKNCSDRKGDPSLNRFEFDASDHSSYVASLDNTEGTVWQYVPGIKNTLYPHQQEGFEFIWKNIAGTTKRDELDSLAVKECGGCIISHSPGTGKTRLTIVFLQSYLERFPNSRPVVIAPPTLLLTWEAEFRKWKANIPFHNMNSQEFSGHENPSAVSRLKGIKKQNFKKNVIRRIKLESWKSQKSVLGVSYHLYEQLAGNKVVREKQGFRRMLLELPGLVVLDEGHTPRNQKSCIWKVLSNVKTENRIILSGTPFQNNFKELSNILCLVRPASTDRISSRLQELSKWSQEGKHERVNYEECRIFKATIAPFVHIHRGNILQENLPGLRECVVVLNPSFQQKKILDRIDPSQTTFELEHKLSAVSVHPSLYLLCKPTKKENLVIGPGARRTLETLRLDCKEGVKTRFLIDFIHFSQTVKEKVLVFSQYLDTLQLIMDQLSAVFGWTDGKEILYMHGTLEQKDRQHLINNFNKPDSESKVLLATFKTCSEGINLVGASRVLLLDVVWNPAVEKQAISRAYRIGQERVVFTYHLMVKGASEWDKYRKQTKKHHISELVFSSTDEKDKLVNNKIVSEDRILDEMVRHDKMKDMFEKILYQPKESDMTSSD